MYVGPRCRSDPNFPFTPGGGDGDTPRGMGTGLWGPYPDKVNEGVVDVGTTGQEEAAAGAELVEEEKLLLLR